MKWYSWINWLGVFFFFAFVLAMLTDQMWVLVGFFFGAAGLTVEFLVQRKEEEQHDSPPTP